MKIIPALPIEPDVKTETQAGGSRWRMFDPATTYEVGEIVAVERPEPLWRRVLIRLGIAKRRTMTWVAVGDPRPRPSHYVAPPKEGEA